MLSGPPTPSPFSPLPRRYIRGGGWKTALRNRGWDGGREGVVNEGYLGGPGRITSHAPANKPKRLKFNGRRFQSWTCEGDATREDVVRNFKLNIDNGGGGGGDIYFSRCYVKRIFTCRWWSVYKIVLLCVKLHNGVTGRFTEIEGTLSCSFQLFAFSYVCYIRVYVCVFCTNRSTKLLSIQRI